MMNKTNADGATMLSVEELAARWRVNAKTIYAAVQQGQIPALKLGRILRISMAVIESVEAQGRVVLVGGDDAGTT
jgi:excisionase family DNA binding protein